MRYETSGPVHARINNWSASGDIDVDTHDHNTGIEVTTLPAAGVAVWKEPQTFRRFLDDLGNLRSAIPVWSVAIRPVPGQTGPTSVRVSLPRGSSVSLALEGGGHTFDTANLISTDLDPERPSDRDARLSELIATRAPTRPLPRPQPEPELAAEPAPPAQPIDLSTAPPATQRIPASGPVYLEALNHTPDGAVTITTHDGYDVVVTAPEGANLAAFQIPQAYHSAAMMPVYRVTASPLGDSAQAADVAVSVPRGSAVRMGPADGRRISVDTDHLADVKYAMPPPGSVRAAGTAWGQVPGPSDDPAATSGFDSAADATGPVGQPKRGPDSPSQKR